MNSFWSTGVETPTPECDRWSHEDCCHQQLQGPLSMEMELSRHLSEHDGQVVPHTVYLKYTIKQVNILNISYVFQFRLVETLLKRKEKIQGWMRNEDDNGEKSHKTVRRDYCAEWDSGLRLRMERVQSGRPHLWGLGQLGISGLVTIS